REVINLDWRTAVGLADTRDVISIAGTPPINVTISGGIHGDQATSALVVRVIGALPRLAPGLRTVLDLPVLHYSPPYLSVHAVH
ncbi:MAG: hypothetical protein CYG59_06545, partial [Chloroflexi bacterium]